MLSIDQCLRANSPLSFFITESDLELLNYLSENYKEVRWSVYSKTLACMVSLKNLLKKKFNKDKLTETTRAESIGTILNNILAKRYESDNEQFDKYLFLDSGMYLNDPQVVRQIKDILSRYQLDPDFTMNMIFISQDMCVPTGLERLGEVVFFDLPDEDSIRNISNGIAKRLELKKEHAPSEEVLDNLKGLTLFEIEQAYLQSHSIYKNIDLGFIRDFKKSAIAKTDLLSLMETGFTFDGIGGMGNLKEWIKKSYGGWTVEGKKFGLPLLKGLLLIGPSGTGKSLISKSLGNEWGLPVICFDPSRIFSSRLGDSESNMRRVLQIIERMAPCILFIDELEKVFSGSQSSTFSDSGVTARVIGSFLIWMQDCTAPVFTIATANNIQYLPPEMVGRFDETFFVNIPQSFERRDIFEIKLKELKRIPDKFDLDELSVKSENFSGREIEQTLKKSMYEAYYNKKELSTEIILKVLEKKTNLLTTMAEQLDYLYKWVGWDEKKKDGIRARFASPSEDLDIGRVQNEISNILKDIEGKKPGM